MKTKTVYAVRTSNPRMNGTIETQYLKPAEFHLVKSMLNHGLTIHGITKENISLDRYNNLFG